MLTHEPLSEGKVDRVSVPVVLDVVGGVAIEGLQIAGDTRDLHATGTTVDVPIAHQIEDVAAGGGMPGLAQKPIRVAVVGVVAVALRGVTLVGARTRETATRGRAGRSTPRNLPS